MPDASTRSNPWTTSTVCALAAIGCAAAVASAALWWPLVTVDSGSPGEQPRLTAIAAGDGFAVGVLQTPLLVAAVVGLLVWWARLGGRSSRVAPVLALVVGGVLALAVGVGTVTIVFPVVEVPVAVLVLAAARLARLEQREGRSRLAVASG